MSKEDNASLADQGRGSSYPNFRAVVGLISFVFLKVKPGARVWAGIALAVAGSVELDFSHLSQSGWVAQRLCAP